MEIQEAFSVDVEGSEIGKKLSDVVTKIVIVGVMIMLLSCILLVVSFDSSSTEFALHYFDMVIGRGVAPTSKIIRDSVQLYDATMSGNLLFLSLNGSVIINAAIQRQQLRSLEIETIVSKFGFVQVSRRDQDVMMSTLSIVLTVFVLLLLGVSACLFYREADEAVVHPIERMIRFVKNLAVNPLQPPKTEDEELDRVQKKFETSLLESTLLSLADLLQVSFGVAGSDIIAKNVVGDTLDPMVPGRKTMVIVGFCLIRKFSSYTEHLQEEVLPFVNQLAEIVHTLVHRFAGATNKNIGSCFLTVWKLPERSLSNNKSSDYEVSVSEIDAFEKALATDYHFHRRILGLANQALTAFLHCIIEVASGSRLARWRSHASLRGSPLANISMGFGLHCGWAIEGAIGSAVKVDASYLSPNVNMAARYAHPPPLLHFTSTDFLFLFPHFFYRHSPDRDLDFYVFKLCHFLLI